MSLNFKKLRRFSRLLFASLVLAVPAPSAAATEFQTARPIWPVGREKEKNLTVGFRAVFAAPEADKVVLRLAGSTLYRVFLNGQFVGQGPARGPHGYFRVDQLDLTGLLKPGRNLVALEVAGYNVNSFYVLDQPSFLQAEVVTGGGKVLVSTAGDGVTMQARVLPERLQKVQRYSFQRPFSEVYRLAPGYDRWRTSAEAPWVPTRCQVQPDRPLLPRRVPYCDFSLVRPVCLVARGQIRTGLRVDKPWKDRSLTAIGPKLGGYLESELETIPSLELQTIGNATRQAVNRPWAAAVPLSMAPNTYQVVDFGVNRSGFVRAEISCHENVRLFVTFDEILSQGDVDFKRLGCVNIVLYELAPGTYEVESFEPYTFRYLKLIALRGSCVVEQLGLREFASPNHRDATFNAGDERLNQLFAAGRETYHQNAIDIFMDCPSRERAGWLCDSFFTARVARDLTGRTEIEKNFLENFLLPKKFPYLPDGMLPMCYPADHNDGVFIPNWGMWFVLQLQEYLARSGDRALVDALRPRVLKLLTYLDQFKNEDGLLEHLPSWVFIEWSKANEFVQDVNYPSNMLFARTLQAAGEMYGLPALGREAEAMRRTIRQQSFDGRFFVDNAIRQDGKLRVTKNHSEVCQYFAFFFDVATPETHPQLWQTLLTQFGPKRNPAETYPEVHPANAFIGNVLRLELLSRAGRTQQLLDESVAYQLYMAKRTGTLWENDTPSASCDHGFASHGGVHVLYRDVLGLINVDTARKKVQLRFTDLRLDRCRGSMPTPDGRVSLAWHKADGKLHYAVTAPAGYHVQVDNRSGLPLLESSEQDNVKIKPLAPTGTVR